MTIKPFSAGKIIFAVLLILCPAPSHADEADVRSRHVLLPWSEDEYVLRYEVVLEKEDGGKYTELYRVSTKESFLVLSLLPGSYRYNVTNYNLKNEPVETTDWESLEVPPPPLNIFLGPSWTTFIPLYGELNQDFGFKIPPPGPRLAFDVLASMQGNFNVGMELAGSWIYLNNFFDEHNIKVNMTTLDFNFLIQKQFPRMAFSFRFGMGLTILADQESQKGAADLNPLTGQVNTGVSFLWLILDSSYIETGIDFSHIFEWNAGCLRPWISFGIRF